MSQDVITLPKLLAKFPRIISGLPGTIKGLKLANITDKTTPVGLAFYFEKAVAKNPNGSALLYENVHLSYRELNAWANRIAHYLRSIGIQKGDVVGIFVENRPELLATVLGCAKLGAINAMVNTQQRGKVLTHSFNLVNPRAVVIGDELTEPFNEIRDTLDVNPENVYWYADQNTLDNEGDAPEGFKNLASTSKNSSEENPASSQQIYINDPLFYIYTSGTTGLPKAVVFNNGRWTKAFGSFGYSVVRLKPTDRIYVTLPLYHATGMVIGWASAIANGSGLVLGRKFSASGFWEDIRKYDATAFAYVGELCRYLMEKPEQPGDRNNKVYKMVGNGMRPNVWGKFKKRFGIDEVYELYASSEGNIGFTNALNFDNTVGFSPLPYSIVKYDKEADAPYRNAQGFMEPVKKGEAGLLIGEITDKTPFHGYTDPEKTAKVLMKDVFKKGDSYFNSGDLMRDIGFKHAQFVDRTGDTFRWKGENVSTTEVENILDEANGITETVIYGVEIPNTNGRCGMASLRLTIAPEEVDFKGIVSYLKKELPHYAIPVFIRISEEMDTTGTFKHQKNKLKEDGYDLGKQANKVFVLLPGADEYIELTAEIQAGIDNNEYRF